MNKNSEFSILPDMDTYNSASEEKLGRCQQRALWHDYHEPRIYMFTIMKHPGIPPFSYIEGQETGKTIEAKSILTRLGIELNRVLKDLPRKLPEVVVLQYIFMPDHVHLLVQVKSRIEYQAGEIVRLFKHDVSARYRGLLQERYNYLFEGSVFTKGFNDRILTHKDQLSSLFRYIQDNPRRLYLRRQHPDYFQNMMLCLSEEEQFGVFGNIFLLENPNKEIVRFSSRVSAEEMEARKRRWEECIRGGGVLVSPFIHPLEKEYLWRALEEGGKVIHICANGFHARWKPTGGFIDPTAEGRMLFVGPPYHRIDKNSLTRKISMAMNDFAEELVKMGSGSFRIRRTPDIFL